MSTLVRQFLNSKLSCHTECYLSASVKEGGGSSFSNGSETQRGPAITLGPRSRRSTRSRADSSDAANSIPGSSSGPPGVSMASLTLEQLMDAVGAFVGEDMLVLCACPYQLL